MTGGADPIVAEREAEIILAPPSALNPIPTLPVALRVDNNEQLRTFLLSTTTMERQLLVFGNASLRTLLMRHVLSDPHNQQKMGKKKNWDCVDQFANIPRELNIVGTRLLFDEQDDTTMGGSSMNVVVYFLSPGDLDQTVRVTQYIRRLGNAVQHRIVYLPQTTKVVSKILQDEGVLDNANVTVTGLQLDVFPLETDLLSLEYDSALKESLVERTPSLAVTRMARTLLKLQDVCGRIPRIQAHGQLAEEVLRKMMNGTVDEYLAAESSQETAAAGEGQVAALILLDRQVDVVTPMISPLTYEGLLNDVVGIDCGFLSVDVEVINPAEDEQKEDESQPAPQTNNGPEIVALALNASDTLYAEVRDQHVEKFGSFLQQQAKALRESHANFTDRGKQKDLAEIHQFVKNIPVFTQNLRSLTNHIHLAELVKRTSEETAFRERWQLERSILEGETVYDALDDLVASQYPPLRFLRLLCLQSLCSGGIKSSRYDNIRRDVVQTYGYEYMFVLQNLERAGLLRRRDGLWIDSVSPFNSIRKALALINAEVDTIDPDDISYVSSGYAPLSVRLVQTAVKRGWSNREDILRELPGRMLDIEQKTPPEDLATATPVTGPLSDLVTSDGTKPILMVAYVGGVTVAEIAALRLLSKMTSFPFHVVCLTTKVVNGNSFIESLA